MSTEPRRLGKYELRERLARGGQGEVWKAFDPQLRRYVAIKQLHANLQSDPDFVSRFEREARFIAALHHPNIVKIHDFQTVQTSDADTTLAYMVMDYVEGPTLAGYIGNTSRKGLFPDATDIVYIFTGVSLALDYAHGKGMIHRDIKPANIMLDQRSQHGRAIGEPILTDFGIAKLQEVSVDTTKVLGTPRYVSPEQAQGLPGDKRSDLYSLGIILYEITTGITPFRADSVMAILMQHYQELPTPPALINPHIPPALSEVILKSIAKDPDARFQSASTMTIALAQSLNVPVPVELRRNIPTPNITAGSNSSNLLQPSLPAGVTPPPSTPSSVQLSPLPVVSSPVVFTPPANGTYAAAQLPTHGVPEAGSHAQPSIYAPTTAIPQTRQAPSPPVLPPARRQKRLYVFLAALLVAIVIGAGVFYTFLTPKTTTLGPVISGSVGQVLFLSSPNAPPGSLDEVRLTLQNIPDAPADKHYYAWLLNGGESVFPVHWTFTVRNGRVSSSPYIDPQHMNLLANRPALFLITLQSVDTTIPSFDPGEHRYYASIPQTQPPASGLSLVVLPCPQNSSNNICIS
jgi:eukaryotic-like serine/threonine-protein kinase